MFLREITHREIEKITPKGVRIFVIPPQTYLLQLWGSTNLAKCEIHVLASQSWQLAVL